MAEIFVLIPGRTSQQGTTLNQSKLTGGWLKSRVGKASGNGRSDEELLEKMQ